MAISKRYRRLVQLRQQHEWHLTDAVSWNVGRAATMKLTVLSAVKTVNHNYIQIHRNAEAVRVLCTTARQISQPSANRFKWWCCRQSWTVWQWRSCILHCTIVIWSSSDREFVEVQLFVRVHTELTVLLDGESVAQFSCFTPENKATKLQSI